MGLAHTAGASQRARMTHSPHAAAASRRFLTPAGAGAGGFYGAGTPRGSHFSVSAAAGAAATAAAAAVGGPAEAQPRFGAAGARLPGEDPMEQRAGDRLGPSGRGGGAGYPPFDSSPGAGPPPASARRSARGEDGGGARGSGTAVKMGRREAWARFLAYEVRRTTTAQNCVLGRAKSVLHSFLREALETLSRGCECCRTKAVVPAKRMKLNGLRAWQGCWQVCLKASAEGGGEPAPFLAEGCAVLRAAFNFDGLLLRPAGPNTPACGATLVWCVAFLLIGRHLHSTVRVCPT